MKNSGWYGQADRIMELVGVNVGLQNDDWRENAQGGISARLSTNQIIIMTKRKGKEGGKNKTKELWEGIE